MAPRRCYCRCHFTIASGGIDRDALHAIEAVTACDACLHLHCYVLLEVRIWFDPPDPPPPPPANFCATDTGEGPEA